jgi:hypothetical protein
MSENRSQLLSRAFRDTALSIGGRILRAPTAGSIDLLQQSENPLFSDSPGAEDSGDLIPLFEFIWIHSAPLDEVLAAAEIEGQIRREARKLAFETPLEDVTEFAAGFQGLQTRLQAAMTEAIPEGDQGKPPTSRTGSPSLSGISEGQGTGSGKNTSSGTSRSKGRSNISTQPSDITGPPADGVATSDPETSPMPMPLPPFSPSPESGS